MKTIITLLALMALTGCAQLGAKVTLPDGTIMSERAYMAQNQFIAEAACHESRKIEMPDNPTSEQVLGFAVASMALQNAKPCSGTNSNDVAIAKTRARWGFASSFARVAAGAYGIGELADFGKSLANAKGDITTYNTEIGNVSQSASSSVSTSSGGSELGSPNNSVNTSEDGVRSNSINIGGNASVAGERSAAGDTALVNGDSSLQSLISDSELKQSPLADDQNDLDNSNGEGFNDADGGNGVSVDF